MTKVLTKVLTGEEAEVFHDATAIFDEWMEDPTFYRIVLKERARLDRSYQRDCPWGNCEISIDPLDNTISMAIGPIGCGCDFFPGWRSSYYEGLPKPGWSAKPFGKYGGRIARSRRKVREHEQWLKEIRRG